MKRQKFRPHVFHVKVHQFAGSQNLKGSSGVEGRLRNMSQTENFFCGWEMKKCCGIMADFYQKCIIFHNKSDDFSSPFFVLKLISIITNNPKEKSPIFKKI